MPYFCKYSRMLSFDTDCPINFLSFTTFSAFLHKWRLHLKVLYPQLSTESKRLNPYSLKQSATLSLNKQPAGIFIHYFFIFKKILKNQEKK